MRDSYQSLAQQFSRRFNARIPAWGDAPPASVGLEQNGELCQRIADHWGGNHMIPFLHSLIMDDREGMRTGFDLPLYRDLLFLLDLARTLPQEDPHVIEFSL